MSHPTEGDEITLEDGSAATVNYMSSVKTGQPVIYATSLRPG